MYASISGASVADGSRPIQAPHGLDRLARDVIHREAEFHAGVHRLVEVVEHHAEQRHAPPRGFEISEDLVDGNAEALREPELPDAGSSHHQARSRGQLEL